MILKKLYIQGVQGLDYIQHPDLVNVAELFQVMRNGRMLIPTTDTPTGSRCKYVSNEGKVQLPADQPVQGHVVVTPSAEIVETEDFYVKYTKEI